MAQFKSEGRIDSVEPRGPAALAGILPGDRLLAINGHRIQDVVGYHFHESAGSLTVEVSRGEQTLTVAIRKDEDADLGLVFLDPTFDGIKRCNNHCPFCFVD